MVFSQVEEYKNRNDAEEFFAVASMLSVVFRSLNDIPEAFAISGRTVNREQAGRIQQLRRSQAVLEPLLQNRLTGIGIRLRDRRDVRGWSAENFREDENKGPRFDLNFANGSVGILEVFGGIKRVFDPAAPVYPDRSLRASMAIYENPEGRQEIAKPRQLFGAEIAYQPSRFMAAGWVKYLLQNNALLTIEDLFNLDKQFNLTRFNALEPSIQAAFKNTIALMPRIDRDTILKPPSK